MICSPVKCSLDGWRIPFYNVGVFMGLLYLRGIKMPSLRSAVRGSVKDALCFALFIYSVAALCDKYVDYTGRTDKTRPAVALMLLWALATLALVYRQRRYGFFSQDVVLEAGGALARDSGQAVSASLPVRASK